MKVWNTKYALTDGLLEQYARETGTPGLLRVDEVYLCGEGKEWHRTRASALARAEAMRLAKITSLKKQLARLEALRFE